MLIDVEVRVTDGRENTAADTEFDVDVFNLKEDFLIFVFHFIFLLLLHVGTRVGGIGEVLAHQI